MKKWKKIDIKELLEQGICMLCTTNEVKDKMYVFCNKCRIDRIDQKIEKLKQDRSKIYVSAS